MYKTSIYLVYFEFSLFILVPQKSCNKIWQWHSSKVYYWLRGGSKGVTWKEGGSLGPLECPPRSAPELSQSVDRERCDGDLKPQGC